MERYLCPYHLAQALKIAISKETSSYTEKVRCDKIYSFSQSSVLKKMYMHDRSCESASMLSKQIS